MERFIADLVKDYESGKVDRREFARPSHSRPPSTRRAIPPDAAPRRPQDDRINHISYACPDYAKARDWYFRCSAWRARRARTTASGQT